MPVMPPAEPFHADGGRTGVLLLHGFTGSPASMRPWGQHLADEGFTVDLPRLPGHGTTWQEMNRTRWQDWYATVDAAFRELHQRSTHVVVCGLSMGGALALQLAQDHGPRISGLVLVNPAIKVEDPRLTVLPVVKHLVGSLAGISNDIKKPGSAELAYNRTPLKALHSQTLAWRDIIRDLPEVTQPVLLLRSPQDHVVPASSSALLLSKISSQDVTEILLEDSFHVATLDNDAPRIFAESADFIERVTR